MFAQAPASSGHQERPRRENTTRPTRELPDTDKANYVQRLK